MLLLFRCYDSMGNYLRVTSAIPKVPSNSAVVYEELWGDDKKIVTRRKTSLKVFWAKAYRDGFLLSYDDMEDRQKRENIYFILHRKGLIDKALELIK